MARDRLQNNADNQSVIVTTDNPALLWAWHAWQTKQDQSNRRNVNYIIGLLKGGEIIGTVVYSHHRFSDIEIHIHTVDKSWCNRRTLKAIFKYPFVELGLNRCTAITDPAAPAVCYFLKRIGFVEEGRLRNILSNKDDLIILGMTREECRWI